MKSYKEKKKNGRHYRKTQNFEIEKKPFLLMSQSILNQKIRFLAQKMRPLAREQTDRRTDRESD